MVEGEEPTATVGCRIESDGYYGTVCFIGPVPPTKGVWLGVEWDDPSRGKHNGTHEGVKYFSTSHLTSGSFLREMKAMLGMDLLRAIQDRYGRIEDENAGVIQEDMFVRGNKNQQTTVQVVGAQSVNLLQSNFQELKELGLRQMYICSAGKGGDIKRNIPNVETLDISLNLLPSWRSVADITQQLEKLTSLNVSDNTLCDSENLASLTTAFSRLKVISLNRMQCTWQQVLEWTDMWPCLQQLHTCFNNISALSDPGSRLQNLRLLNLESNPITNWQQVLSVGHLPRIETLILNDTGLENISFPDVNPPEKTSYFPSLVSLSAYNNNIKDWNSINELNKLKELTKVNIGANPLLKERTPETCRSLIIGKIKKLEYCNRTEVPAGERKGAEVDYMKTFGKVWKAMGGDQDPQKNNPSQQFTADHPRYQELVDKYGPPEDSELVEQSSALKNQLLSIKIKSKLAPEKPAVTRKLPGSMTVQKVKTLIQRLYKADPSTLKITYSSIKMVGQEIEFENELREIGFYSIEDGDTINVSW